MESTDGEYRWRVQMESMDDGEYGRWRVWMMESTHVKRHKISCPSKGEVGRNIIKVDY